MSADGQEITAEYVIGRLQEAVLTVRALPGAVGPKRLSAQSYGYVAELCDDVAPGTELMIRASAPDREAIGRMDEALPWLSLIKTVAGRRIVSLRAVVHPLTERHRHSWASIARMIGCDARAVQRWHATAIGEIVEALKAVKK